ncbi:jasmonate O-methyltransferase [Prunus yedoensis var. nudiflora]|uniref:Jasmonate O-methyltransferase n=1 Tax=Prunus yedoensis var. nudiflora TaxID=2094558 RepID=A0A314XUF6_PRUYE|nr:jasmonate O-methyltransferase [Prunus yedoensis var. nudiflora]
MDQFWGSSLKFMYVFDSTASWEPVTAPSADMCPPGVLFVTRYRQPETKQSTTKFKAASKSMDVERVFHMNGGVGHTSYARNSSLQKEVSDMALPDFSKGLSKEKNDGSAPIYIGGYPGSFYGRLFPNNSLHFVYSSCSLHWLSRVPPAIYEQGKSINKGSVHISESSPPGVSQAYLKQFQEDFTLFLKSRSEELTVGGRMVLILLGRKGPDHVDRGNSFFWSFSLSPLPFWFPRLEVLELDQRGDKDNESYGTSCARTVRAIQESMIAKHFGEKLLDSLFETYGRLIDEESAKGDINPISFGIVLRKL